MSTLVELLYNSTSKTPQHIAFKCNKMTLSYTELSKKSTLLAVYLVSVGVKKGDRVGIYLNRCLETSFAIYGILLSGAAYVPLDPDAGPERNAYIARDCDLRVIITSNSQRRKFEELSNHDTPIKNVVGLANSSSSVEWDFIFQQKTFEKTLPEVLPSDIAYILYTSGSTGFPKGIVHTHESGFAFAKLSANYYKISTSDIVANHAAINFDISTLGYFSGVLVSATIVIITDPYIMLSGSLLKLIHEESISIWYSVPTALINFLNQKALDQEDFKHLKWVLFAGEPFPTPKLRKLMQHWPQAKFSNIFGPTEVNGCTYLILDKAPKTDEPISIGKALGDTEILIVDNHDEEVCKGDAGEMLVCTVTMMKEYWNNPEKTASSLFLKKDKVYYRTGDMIKENEDGNYTFLGRKDRQVKVRGYRIELDEIDATLWRHPRVKEAATIVCKGENNEGKIVSYWVPNERKTNLDTSSLQSFCIRHLASYAIPSEFIEQQELPRTGRGKIDYMKLECLQNEEQK
ncbi:MAG: amino acid adenylation domain-containing protein [Bacteroidota bacterium]